MDYAHEALVVRVEGGREGWRERNNKFYQLWIFHRFN